MSSSEKSSGTTEQSEDQLLEHAYDGIQEFDNPMPRWWVRIFWGSFVFSLGYMFHYWAGNGQTIEEDFKDEMAVVNAARAKEALAQKVSEDVLDKLLADATSVEAGGAVFAARCAACHLEKGQGSIGPNLTDNHWIHGKGALMDIYKTVAEGVPAKGMPEWSRQLTPSELRQVVAFVGTLRGTNVEGKPPEGEAVP